ncbi:hypothetical protein DFA_00283 [Cavenderia fasciculata]|uniref:Uncharacterized protein n=1 Tax=Cavenderia fasciculata TaxID=261658 RepID=F4PY45_CACFS|nr:uncharacterized protein DFA_00283 [Cavenderia fasciculata]EGG19705.1 hypothetical protein DFA_00283 [Cavenderia fasciculata]|eukprot:XP_004357999.1 hypothetical protein DFA_00283 [Cavenderia fasciculata]
MATVNNRFILLLLISIIIIFINFNIVQSTSISAVATTITTDTSNNSNNSNSKYKSLKDGITPPITTTTITSSVDSSSYEFSYSENDSSGGTESNCGPIDPSQYALLIGGDLERASFRYGFNLNTSVNVLTRYTPIMSMEEMDDVPYEGESFATFTNTSSVLGSLPVLFPNFIGNTTHPPENDPYGALYLNFNFRVRGGDTFSNPNSPNNAYISITLNNQEIDRLRTNSTPPAPYYDYSYHPYRINVTQFANGTYYNLTFQYVQPSSPTPSPSSFPTNDQSNSQSDSNSDSSSSSSGSSSSSQSSSSDEPNQVIFIIDYITFISQPLVLIENDIYISINGSDKVGNGTMTNPYCSLTRAIDMIGSGYKIYLLSNFSYADHLPYAPYQYDTQGKNMTITTGGWFGICQTQSRSRLHMDRCVWVGSDIGQHHAGEVVLWRYWGDGRSCADIDVVLDGGGAGLVVFRECWLAIVGVAWQHLCQQLQVSQQPGRTLVDGVDGRQPGDEQLVGLRVVRVLAVGDVQQHLGHQHRVYERLIHVQHGTADRSIHHRADDGECDSHQASWQYRGLDAVIVLGDDDQRHVRPEPGAVRRRHVHVDRSSQLDLLCQLQPQEPGAGAHLDRLWRATRLGLQHVGAVHAHLLQQLQLYPDPDL